MKALLRVTLASFVLAATGTLGADQVQVPTFSPSPGPYRGSQVTVTIQCGTPAATIFYTTNGSDPTPSAKSYSGPISISGTTTVKARAYKYGMAESRVASGVYTSEQSLRAMPAPVLQPPAQVFTRSEITVSATCSESGAVLRYTTDGREPTASSPELRGAVVIDRTTTVKVRAFKAGMAESAVTTGLYVKGSLPVALAPVLQPSPRTFTEPLDVGRGDREGGSVIRYTLDGNDPTSSSPEFHSPLRLTKTTVVKARAFKEGKAPSAVVTGVYTWVAASPLTAPVLQPPSHTFESAELTVGAACSESGAVIRYTTDGSDPTSSSPVFPGRLKVDRTTTVKVRAFKAGKPDSPVAFAIYTKGKSAQAPAPVFEPASGALSAPYKVRIASRDGRATICVTRDGSEPSMARNDFFVRGGSTWIEVTPPVTLKARAYVEGLDPSPVVTASYARASLKPVAAPVLQPPSHTFTAPELSVGAACSESGAVIRYTTNGSDPTGSSPVFPSRLVLTQTTTVKARAFKPGMDDSPVATVVYTRGTPKEAPAPVLVPPREVFTPPFEVVMGCEDRQAEIRYTLDGSEPSAGSPRYSGPIRLTETRTIRARTFKAGMTPSRVVTGVYERDLRPIRRPVLFPSSKSFTPPLEVVIGCEDRQAEIRYTLDGSEPNAGSPRYSGPIRLTETKTIQARAFRAGMTPSEVVAGTYTRLAVTPAPGKGVVTPEERSKSAEECAKVLGLQREVERLQKEIEKLQKEIERMSKERTERRKKLGLDPDPDCRIR